ncbi:hydantoinase/oxoprolinase family protein [Candidatus Bathyarchaeota archaeon]|nr:MAG: hydantoinase/oxoprolinase family protein [Candidatus Bathyarchaeota archaeon]
MFRVSIDVGGTFTDLVAMDDQGELINIKVPTTPRSPEEGVLEAFKVLLKEHEPGDIRLVTHATTITTNALFGQISLELPKAALITTRGFRDVLEIGRQRRPELYNLFFQRPRPLVPRRYRYELRERIGPNGEELEPVSPEDLADIIDGIRHEGIRSVAVGLINSYANPRHEEEVREALERACPGVYVTISCEISPEYREYERISTAVVNVVLIPIVHAYMESLLRSLKRLGVSAPFYVMQSNGGLARAGSIIFRPATIVESGPASGVVASAFYGRLLGLGDVMSFDMGGTTAKAGAVRGGVPETVSEYEVGGRVHRGRVVKGSGYPVRFPFIDLAECSAGGGTIAWVDEGGALRVGPLSAGAHPGPACYGLGNREPTITDANLVLGRLNQRYLLGGEMRIHADLAREALRRRICDPLGLDLPEAASSIVEISNSIMAKILRMVSVERGYDPRSFSLIAFGGAGPMHACALAEELGIPLIVVPVNPGLFSAMGLLVSDVVHIYLRAVMRTADEVSPSDLEEAFRELEGKGERLLGEDGFPQERMVFLRELDMRYIGQSYELSIPAPRPLSEGGFRGVVGLFHERHRGVYGYAAEGEAVEVVNVRLRAVGVMAKPRLRTYPEEGPEPKRGSVVERREVFFEALDDYTECPVYRRARLAPGNRVEGPAIIEQYDSTTVLYPGWKAHVDEFRNLRLTPIGQEEG